MTDPLAEFRAAGGGHRLCGVKTARLAMTTDQRRALDLALKDPTISGPAVSRVLKSWGFEVGVNRIYVHRKGECSCAE